MDRGKFSFLALLFLQQANALLLLRGKLRCLLLFSARLFACLFTRNTLFLFLLLAGDTRLFHFLAALLDLILTLDLRLTLRLDLRLAGVLGVQSSGDCVLDLLLAGDLLLAHALEFVHEDLADLDFFHIVVEHEFLGQTLEHLGLDAACADLALNILLLNGIVLEEHIVGRKDTVQVVAVFVADHLVRLFGDDLITDFTVGGDELPQIQTRAEVDVLADDVGAHDGRTNRRTALQVAHESGVREFIDDALDALDTLERRRILGVLDVAVAVLVAGLG